MPRSDALILVALLAVGSALGCCRDQPIVALVDGGWNSVDGGPDAGDAGDSGTGRRPDAGANGDAGTCRVGDGGLVARGTWVDPFYGSCAICIPTLNPNGWTVLDAGEICESFNSVQYIQLRDPLVVPTSGRCAPLPTFPFGSCDWGTAGSICNEVDGFGCGGGFCNDAGWCEVDQNLGWFTSCGISPNPCAQGLCCPDAGLEGFVDGGGWCCGLVDGGVDACLTSGEVCVATSDCCEGLSCTGSDAVYANISGYGPGGDAGYGFCK